jgi:hypothetical protein
LFLRREPSGKLAFKDEKEVQLGDHELASGD